MRRAGELAARGIGFVDAGTSGEVWGRTEGYCLMVGGDAEHVAAAQRCSARWCRPRRSCAHTGPAGTGHFTKMVLAVEYGLMQAYAEGYELLVGPTWASTPRR